MVKETLDRQLKEQIEQRGKIQIYNKKMDKMMLSKAHRELEQEKRERLEMKKKVELQKVQRDVMLAEAKEKRMREFAALRRKELEEVKHLKKEIIDE
jgi:hypothetical protein